MQHHNEDKHNGCNENEKIKKKKKYEKELRLLQIELLKLQKHVLESKKRLLIILEGRDAAGKGGMIKTLLARMNPRSAKSVALPKPTESQRSDWYFRRYIKVLPKQGEIVLFDRSWYNRAGVEKVMGFCTLKEYSDFIYQVLNLEQMLASSGLIIFKYFLNITQEEQRRRIERRQVDPLRKWKLSEIDMKALKLWDEYNDAFSKMLSRTHNSNIPWVIVESNNKPKARLNLIRDLLSRTDYEGKEKSEANLISDPNILHLYSANTTLHQKASKQQKKKDK